MLDSTAGAIKGGLTQSCDLQRYNIFFKENFKLSTSALENFTKGQGLSMSIKFMGFMSK